MYEFLSEKFLEAMNDIGRYGHEKYGQLTDRREEHAKPPRVTPIENAKHACTHFGDYLCGKLHDHFGTAEHQLAAVAFNAMMEFQFRQGDAAAVSETESISTRKEGDPILEEVVAG